MTTLPLNAKFHAFVVPALAICVLCASASAQEATARPMQLGLDQATRNWINIQPYEARERWAKSDAPDEMLLSVLDAVLLSGAPLTSREPRLRKAALINPEAAVVLGLALLRGDLASTRAGEAAAWLAEASRSGHPHACVELAQLYRTGNGVPRDPDYADVLLDYAAEYGHLGAQKDRILEALQRSEPLADHLIAWGDNAAALGDPVGYTVLARAMLESEPDESAVEQALEALEVAAAEGEWAAQTILAELDLGENLIREARSRIEGAALEEWMPAQLLMAMICEQEGSLDEAVSWSRKAASSGDTLARLHLAELLARSEDSINEAIEIAGQMAGDGDLDGHYLYGLLLLEHRNADAKEEAIGILAIAAEQGHGLASYALSQYHDELGNFSLVVKYLRKAAGVGVVDALWELGEIMRDYHPAESVRWWAEGASAGDERAIRALSQAYRIGFGVPQDVGRAESLLALVSPEQAGWTRHDLAPEVGAPLSFPGGSRTGSSSKSVAPYQDLEQAINGRGVGRRRPESRVARITDEELNAAHQLYMEAKKAIEFQEGRWMTHVERESKVAGDKGAQAGWFALTEHPTPDDWIVEQYEETKSLYELLQLLRW